MPTSRLAALRCATFVLFALATPMGVLAAQDALLQAGPMVGYSEMREVLLWVQTRAPARVQFVYWDTAAPGRRYATAEVRTSGATALTAHVVADSVEPGRRYAYELRIDGRAVARPYPLRFQTQRLWQWREDPPPFRVAMGSCAYVNEAVYDRPGDPYGSNHRIFGAIAAARPDLMIWLGDNTYLREADWYSRTGIMRRYTHTRSLPEMQPLLGATHNYAIWDDHDYGPNNSDRSFREKNTTLEAFRLFWGNPTVGVGDLGGITTMFQWADAEFFLLDNRTHRTPNARVTGDRQMLGRDQIEWLIDALAFSQAPFKLVLVGSQTLNQSAPRAETHSMFPAERDYLLRRLAEENIPGVVFVSGDRHHTELTRMEREGNYPLYDITVSPLTAGVSTWGRDEQNTMRVPNTLVMEHNFATLDFSGPRTDRVMKITIWSATGSEIWTREIRASELRRQ